MNEEEERHADEVNIAFQMGAEWQMKRSEAAWKGIHEGAVMALQARIEQLEAETERLKEANFLLEAGLQEVGDDYPGSSCQNFCQHTIGLARAALEGKKDEQ